MDQSYFSRNSFGFLLLFAFAFFSPFLFSAWTDPGIVAYCLNLLVLGLSAFRTWKGAPAWSKAASLGLLLVSLGISGLPFDKGNPFDFFRFPVFQNLFSWLPAFAGLYLANRLKERELSRFYLLVPLLFLVGINTWFVVLDFKEIPAFDSSRHLMNALQVYSSITGESGMKLWEVFMHYDFYQPVSYIAPSPFFLLFGKSYTSALLCQVLFWLPLAYLGIWKTLGYLRYAFSIRAFVCLLVLSSAMSLSLLRHFMQDFPVLALAIWFQYFVLRSGYFKSPKASWQAGWVFALGVLTKASFLFFLPGVAVFALLQFFRKPISLARTERIQHLLFLVLPVVLLVGSWFLVNRAHYNYTLPSMKNFAELNHLGNAEELASWHWYWPRIPKAGSIGLVLLVLGSVVFLFRRSKGWNLALAGILGFVLPVVVLGFIPNKDVRTIFPLQAFYVVPVAFFLRSLPLFAVSGIYALGLPSVLLVGFSMTQGWSWNGPDFLRPTPFMVETRPLPPSSPCPNHSFFSYAKAMEEVFPDEIFQRLSFSESDNYHSRAAYHLLLENKNFKTRAQTHKPGEVLAFTRPLAWPDHYLWRLYVQDSTLVLQQLAREEQIDGDLQIELYWLDSQDRGLKQDVHPLEAGKTTWTWPVMAGASKVRYGWKVHYTHPRGQWVQLIYDLLGESAFQTFNVPFQIFQAQGNPTETLVMPLSAPVINQP